MGKMTNSENKRSIVIQIYVEVPTKDEAPET